MRFWAVVKYELLWNIRKRKFLGMLVLAFALATLSLVLPTLLSGFIGQPLGKNPDYVVSSGSAISGLGFFLFGLVTVMNTVSSEFESGTIIPLLTKPISRTTVFLGKLTGAVITLLPVYLLLFAYQIIGGTLVYGPQSNLNLVVLVLLGSLVSTMVWMGVVLALGSVSKSTMLAALVAFGIFIGISIVGGTVASFSGQQWIMTYLPGSGASGYTNLTATTTVNVTSQGFNATTGALGGLGASVSSGTDAIGSALVAYALNPMANVTFYKTAIQYQPGGVSTTMVPLYSEPLWFVALRALAVASIYIVAFSLISWYAIRRAQVTE
jgi:ABC-type transport system involved in multi-copper enzyme maturation permease subunit